MEDFEIGDIVYVKGNRNITMCVSHITKNSDKSISIKCIWFDKNDQINERVFDSRILSLYYEK